MQIDSTAVRESPWRPRAPELFFDASVQRCGFRGGKVSLVARIQRRGRGRLMDTKRSDTQEGANAEALAEGRKRRIERTVPSQCEDAARREKPVEQSGRQLTQQTAEKEDERKEARSCGKRCADTLRRCVERLSKRRCSHTRDTRRRQHKSTKEKEQRRQPACHVSLPQEKGEPALNVLIHSVLRELSGTRTFPPLWRALVNVQVRASVVATLIL